MDLLAQADLTLVERMLDKYGLAICLVLLFALGFWRRVLPAAEKWFTVATQTQESNAATLANVSKAQSDTVRCMEQLSSTSVKSSDNHAKTHRAGVVAADALQAFAVAHSEQAGAAVKPHVERIKEILDK